MGSLRAGFQVVSSVAAAVGHLRQSLRHRSSCGHQAAYRVKQLFAAPQRLPIALKPCQLIARSYQSVAPPTQVADQGAARRVYTDWTIYKGKASVSFKVIRPEWQQRPDGAIEQKRVGVLLLEFAQVMPGSAQSSASTGDRRYDWENKQTFALSPVELGTLIAQAEPLSFMHDPNKGSSGEGQTIKSLAFKPIDNKPGYYYLNLNVRDQTNFQASVPVTPGEFATIVSISQFLIPRLLGFGECFEAWPLIHGEAPAGGM